MNSVYLSGRLARDPEKKKNVAYFTIAVDRQTKTDQKADFFRIVTFNRVADTCMEYLRKGREVIIEGSLHTDSYTNKNGDEVKTTEVIANRVEFVGKKTEEKKVDLPGDFEQVDADIPF